MEKDCFNYFGQRGTKVMKWWGEWRTEKLKPLLWLLDKLRISPNALSVFAIPFLIGAVLLLRENVRLSFLCLLAHYMLDCLDGSLARYQKRASQKGHFVDLCIDQMGVILFILALIWNGLANPFFLTWFLSMYLVTIAFAIILNLRNSPAEGTIMGARHFLYGSFYVQALWHFPIFQPVTSIIAIYETLVSLQLFRKLRCVM